MNWCCDVCVFSNGSYGIGEALTRWNYSAWGAMGELANRDNGAGVSWHWLLLWWCSCCWDMFYEMCAVFALVLLVLLCVVICCTSYAFRGYKCYCRAKCCVYSCKDVNVAEFASFLPGDISYAVHSNVSAPDIQINDDWSTRLMADAISCSVFALSKPNIFAMSKIDVNISVYALM